MTNITEIIPDNMPEWMQTAMDSGQLFNETVKYVERMHKVTAACEDYMEFMRGDDYHEGRAGNYENAIFEVAMNSVYGKEIWDEISEIMD